MEVYKFRRALMEITGTDIYKCITVLEKSFEALKTQIVDYRRFLTLTLIWKTLRLGEKRHPAMLSYTKPDLQILPSGFNFLDIYEGNLRD